MPSRSLECPLNGEIFELRELVLWSVCWEISTVSKLQFPKELHCNSAPAEKSDFNSIILLPALPSDSKNGFLLSSNFLLFSVWVRGKLWANPSIYFLNREYIPFPIKVFFMCTQIHLTFRSCLFCLTQAKQGTSRCFRVCSSRFFNLCLPIFSTEIARRCGEQNESP